MYSSNSSSHPSALIGGLSPANDHDVIDRPDLVSLVIPPSTTIEKVQAAQNASHFARAREDWRESPAAMPASGPRRGGPGRGSEEVAKEEEEEKSGRRGRRVVVETSDDDRGLVVVTVGIRFEPVLRRAAWARAAATNERDWFGCLAGTTTLREDAKEEPPAGEKKARREVRAIVFATDEEALVDVVAAAARSESVAADEWRLAVAAAVFAAAVRSSSNDAATVPRFIAQAS